MAPRTKTTKVKQSTGSSRLDITLSSAARASPGHVHKPTHQQIRDRAYEIHTARKGEYGNATVDWLQAERDLKTGAAHASTDH